MEAPRAGWIVHAALVHLKARVRDESLPAAGERAFQRWRIRGVLSGDVVLEVHPAKKGFPAWLTLRPLVRPTVLVSDMCN